MAAQIANTEPRNISEPDALPDEFSPKGKNLTDDASASLGGANRRARERFPIPYTFRLIPVDDDGAALADEATTVVGKDISLSGVAFSHDHELRRKRAILSLDHRMVGRFAVEIEVVWTRITPIGLFESGCRLVRTIDGHIVRGQ